MSSGLTIVHVTHEAVQKFGGIGAVLDGLIPSRPYQARVGRTILLGPLFSTHGGAAARLGRGGEVWYSSLDGVTGHPASAALQAVARRYGVGIVYGQRTLQGPDPASRAAAEVLLIDVSHIDAGAANALKLRLFEEYGIASDRFEGIWDYEQYVRLAVPAVDALRALGVTGDAGECVVVAHEFMGMPTALAAMLDGDPRFHTVFYAHEVATVRRIVEEHPGHDTVFYNVLRAARREGRYLAEVFGDQSGYFKHGLVEASQHCGTILAVGDYVVEELKFLSPAFAHVDIALTYNGIPARRGSAAEAEASGAKLRSYCENLLGFRPDYVFTHVARLVTSKGLWRDLWVMRYVEERLRRENRTAVLLVLATEIGGPRRPEDVRHMERWWKWPVAHREGLPDLSGGEALFYAGVQEHNARSRCSKVVFINQFGFDREHCGERMPEGMDFWDLRRGSDAEFGQSVYEPFGIAQLEALSYGSVCVLSSVCGCVGFVSKVSGGEPEPNVVVADYLTLPDGSRSVQSLLAMSREERERFNDGVARGAAERLMRLMPRDAAEGERHIARGYDLARKMSWDVVAEEYFLPAIRRAMRAAREPATA